ncbi:DUF1992 domain-containing protein [Pseudarthrobacter sp. J75]|uniref:DnaJ family domain-containing protein n=1 Tax=unclassified Pseudarthrobacter TaxID=2647000 RepID=UPI002E82283E|nr:MULTISPECIES: DUF1992 domain-containing protein [unclassified Pseudarthrobacter]MEE2522337.1 DUF1992 domain-containing protein [Pseudarthrobacter sp. J47]MEE2528017.1 DUF1992 domain-containing protein [Pseudarthrobacter sp. J75]
MGDDFRRRLERLAELRSYRGAGITPEEEAELSAAEAADREKRRKTSEAARADYLVREAMAQGKFDNLKYAGKPIPGLGEAYDPDWWVKGLLQREDLSGLGPKAILLRKEDAGLDARLDAQYTEKQVRDMLEDFNARVIDARRQLQGGPPVVTKTRDVDAELQRWRERRDARKAAEPPSAEPSEGGWRRFLRRRS